MSEDEKIKFSFEYYDDRPNAEYCISCWSPERIKKSLHRLKDINTKSSKELSNGRNREVYHFKEVDWEKTKEPNGFPNRRANEMTPFHFALLGVNNQFARVYGAFSSGIFYIIWFDLNHKIWPTKLKNT